MLNYSNVNYRNAVISTYKTAFFHKHVVMKGAYANYSVLEAPNQHHSMVACSLAWIEYRRMVHATSHNHPPSWWRSVDGHA